MDFTSFKNILFFLKIVKFMEGICDIIPNNPDEVLACKKAIDEYIPQLFEAIINNWGNPEVICEGLTLCP